MEESSNILVILTLDTEFCKIAVQEGAIEVLIRLLSTNTLCQSYLNFLIILNNIAGDCSRYRNLIIEAHGVEVIMKIKDNKDYFPKIAEQKI
jgi:hypothetical protein